jgi:hypothetical protein
MQVRILKPAKSAMQSAHADNKWLLEFVKQPRCKFKEATMGRTSSTDMSNELKILFSTLQQAITFANKKALTYEMITPKEPKIPKKSYATNFK